MSEENAVHREIMEYCEQVRKGFINRDRMFAGIEGVYMMRLEDEAKLAKIPNVKITKSPDARNAVIGARRLLTTTDPQINVPRTKNDPQSHSTADLIEAAMDADLRQSGRVMGRPVHYDVVQSHLLYDESHIIISSAADMVSAAEEMVSRSKSDDTGAVFRADAVLARAKRIQQMTPFPVEVRNPRKGYPIFDSALGIQTGYHSVEMRTWQSLVDQYGQPALRAMQSKKLDYVKHKHRPVEEHQYIDYTWRHCFILGCDEPLYLQEHGLPFLPAICTVGEGSRMFDSEEARREPFLFTELESGFWARQSLSYTVLYTLMAVYGFSPLFRFRAGNNSAEAPTLERMGLFQYVNVPPGAEWDVVANKGIIDAAWLQAMEIAERKVEENTIYKSTLGGFLGGGTPYSTHALLSALGRLPLETIRRMSGWALGDVLRTKLLWMKHDQIPYETRNTSRKVRGDMIRIEADDIPDNIEIEVTLDVALPQDKQSQATTAAMLWGKLSSKFLTEEILQVPGYEQEQEQLMTETAISAIFQSWLGRIITIGQQMQQMSSAERMNAGQPQMQAAPAGVPPEVAASMSPEMLAGGMQGPDSLMPPMVEGG